MAQHFYDDVIVTGKRNVRTVTLTDSATITVDSNATDIGVLTSLSQDSLFAAPTGTPDDNQLLQYRITSSSPRALTFNVIFSTSSSLALPTSTTGGGKEDYLAFRYNSTTLKWNLIASSIAAPLQAALDTISTTQGGVLYRGASSWIALAPGTSGFALTSNGAAADPSYSQIPVIVDKSVRFTPSTGETGIIPTMQMAAISSNFTLANATGVQACFPTANDTLTLSGSTSYMVEGYYKLSTGNITHTTGIAFGGTLTATNFEYEAMLWNAAANTITTTQSTCQVSGLALKVLNTTSNAVVTNIKFKGILRVNTQGTIIPQISFNAVPTGTCVTAIGSYITFTPLGSSTLQSIGNWS